MWAVGLLIMTMLTQGCNSGRVSGTYIAKGDNSVSMLQLGQAQSGQITGVLSTIELSPDGRLSSDNTSITGGVFDGGQLTLTLHPGIFGTNISGRKQGSRIQLQWAGEKGAVASAEYVPGSQEQFARYANQLKGKAGSIVLSSGLATRARKLTEAVNRAEQWMSNAQVHAQRIPNARSMYQQIESRMRTLLVREHSTANSVARSQISVMVNQGDIAGNQVDIDVDQVWDQSLGTEGSSIRQTMAGYRTLCESWRELDKHGASPDAERAWRNACDTLGNEQNKFEPVYQRIVEQRNDLRRFQAQEKANRAALVTEASRME
jgi:hypothetical protein